tara:strand:- start:1952 stop:3349 length:1398 start_codon:yes stop_codon:yes gene_type:complete
LVTKKLSKEAQTLFKLRNDPVLFVKTCLKAQPQEWQEEALKSLLTDDRLVIRSGHGVGKSAFLSWVIIWWLLTHYPCKIACTANTAHQLSDVLWSELQKWIKNLPEGFQNQLEIKSDKINLSSAPDSFCVARTSRKETPEALQGFHSDNMLFILDEASGIPDIVFETGQGSMSTPGAKTVMVGNPTRSNGFFAKAFDSDKWKKMTVSCLDSPQVDKNFVTEMKDTYGEESNIYRVRILGLPPEAEDDVCIPQSLILSAVDRVVEGIQCMPIWGLDVARMGSDRSALCKRKGNVVSEPIKTWRDKDLMQLTGIILTEYESVPYEERPSEILVDSIGLGAGVVDRLIELDLPARGINVAESSSVNQKYVRLRDELWFRGREWLEEKNCIIPKEDETLIAELSVPRFTYTSSGKLKVESKDEMKKRGHKSPDVADAFLLTFAGVAVRASGSSHRYNRPLDYGNQNWIV